MTWRARRETPRREVTIQLTMVAEADIDVWERSIGERIGIPIYCSPSGRTFPKPGEGVTVEEIFP